MLLVGLMILALLSAGGAGYAYHLSHGFRRTDVRGLTGSMTTGREQGTENILMAGSTSRCALSVQNAAYGLCSQGVNGVNSDVIMILHVDPAHHRLALLSVPRDLFIPNARSDGANKVDAALYQGLTQLVTSIEEDLGIPIQHAVSLNFDQFANVVDALGGINMSFPMSVYDSYSGLNVQAATCVHLSGTQALQVVRARHLQYDAAGSSAYAAYWPQENLSDLARIRRDHEFLRVLGTAAARRGLGNPVSDVGLVDSLKADLTFDQSWSVTDMAHLLLDFHSVDISAVPQLTLPVSVVTDPDGAGGSLLYRGASYGSVEFPAQPLDRTTIDQVLGIPGSTDPMTGEALPAPSSIRVSVLNGTGTYQQGADTASALAGLGFHIAGTGDTAVVGDVSETVVYYGSRSASSEAAAEVVAGSLSGPVAMAYDPSRVVDGAQATVVTGTQFAVNSPAAPVQGSGAGGTTIPQPTSTTTTVPSRGTSPLTTPTSAVTNLAPWDPRSCPSGVSPSTPVANRI